MRRPVMALLATLAAAAPAAAQTVGTTPERSPFRDLEKRQDFTLLMGLSTGGKDRAGAAPRGGGVVGARYDVKLGSSMLAFTTSFLRQGATRDILQPGLPLASRVGATTSQALYFLDGGLTLGLTGNRAWRSIVPSLTLGGGLVFDPSGVKDSSLFTFGTRFAPLVGLGVKYAPVKSRWTMRADITTRLYSVPYPQRFRDSTPGAPRIVPNNVNNSWTRNTMFMLGLTREVGRR